MERNKSKKGNFYDHIQSYGKARGPCFRLRVRVRPGRGRARDKK